MRPDTETRAENKPAGVGSRKGPREKTLNYYKNEKNKNKKQRNSTFFLFAKNDKSIFKKQKIIYFSNDSFVL